MDDLIQVLALLRERHNFRGYIHVKIVPGADDTQIERIGRRSPAACRSTSKRPAAKSLATIAPDKQYATSLVSLERARTRVVLAQDEERRGGRAIRRTPAGSRG